MIRQWVAFYFLIALLISPVRAIDWERVQTSDGQVLTLQGISLNRSLNEDYYLAALYLARPIRDGGSPFDASQTRRLHFRVVADRIYAAGINRHFRDLILINNPRDEINRDALSVQRFTGLFRFGLISGDDVLIEQRAGKTTTVVINGQKAAEFSGRLFDFILRGWIGDKPPGAQFKASLLGQQDQGERSTLITRFDTLIIAEERLKLYANVDTTPVTTTIATGSTTPVQNLEKEVIKAPEKNSEIKATVLAKPDETKAASEKPLDVKPNNNNTPTTPSLTSQQIEQMLQLYRQGLMEKFEQAKTYPTRELKRKFGLSQMARVKATVLLRLHIDKGGDINAAWLQKRSAEPVIDNAALALVDQLAPFSPLPDALPEQSYEFFIELNYNP